MICIDSDCIIDFLKGNEKVIKTIEKYKNEICTTEINAFEIFFGAYRKFSKEEINEASRFFNSIDVLSFDKPCGKISAEILSSLLKQGKEIEQNDCFIASIMIKNHVKKIITRNKKHFSKIKDIEVITP